ncbi:MAG TPA: serine/threonine-protein kinase, partial [Polyangiales bacterium]
MASRYELGDELARGGMGVVYRAFDRATGRTLAFKRSLSHHGASRSMLQREYQTLVTLRHPHIIQVYDYGVDDIGPYYTMELLDGVDLRAKCPLPWRELCAYLRDVASSLALLHSRRLIHSDVTVGNIRLTSEGRAKLLDFGALASFGRNAQLAGTPPTISPEALANGELDARADLYALGGTAYYALCGLHAYPAGSLALLPAIWERGRPAPPSELVEGIPAELDELVLSLLELERDARPGSAAEVMDRLAAIAGLPPDEDQRVQRSYLHTTVVGRDAELSRLRERLTAMLSGRGSGALIEGETGLGKSALLEEIAQAARLAGACVLSANARTRSGALGLWSSLAEQAAQLLGVTVRPSMSGSSPEAVFLELQDSRPVVIAIEDLHDADQDSVAACANLAKSIGHKRVLLLATLDPARNGAQRPAVRLLC